LSLSLTPRSPLFPYTTLFRSVRIGLSSNRVFLLLVLLGPLSEMMEQRIDQIVEESAVIEFFSNVQTGPLSGLAFGLLLVAGILRSEEHTSELQSRENLVCRLL